MANIIETGIEFNKITDIKYMRSYLMQLNDDLRYMLNNIDLDNFTEEGTESYLEREEHTSKLSETVDNLKLTMKNVSDEISTKLSQTSDSIDLLVEKGDVTNSISISTDKICLTAERLHVYSDNFYLDDDTLKINGTVIAQAGEIAGFTIAKDSSGNEYLEGGSGASMTSGMLDGTKGVFKSFKCTDNLFVYDTSVYMINCQITSTGLELTGNYNTGAIDIATYVESTDTYRSWQPLYVENELYVSGDVRVGKNMDDSGYVYCYSIISGIDGERPGDYEDSDIRLKEDTEAIEGSEALSFLMDTRPVSFKFKDRNLRQPGVIAQEAAALEERYKDYGIVDDSEEYLLVSYTRYVPLMAAAIKEMDKRIDEVRNGSI